MPNTSSKIIDAYFNPEDWPKSSDMRLMYYLRLRSAHHRSLRSMEVFDEVIRATHGDLQRTLKPDVTLLDVKIRVQALKNMFHEFLEFIRQPGVHFDRDNLKVHVDATQLVERHGGQSRENYKENITNRWFESHGFPMYFDCVEVFATKNAGNVDFRGHPGYIHMSTLAAEDSDKADDGDDDNGEGQEEKRTEIVPHFGGNNSPNNLG